MATELDLFLAILALDSYNRGFGPGMTFTGDSDEPGTPIGDATILVPRAQSNVSFYAVAYEVQSERQDHHGVECFHQRHRTA